MMQTPQLPAPTPEALAASNVLLERIRSAIEAAGGWLPFSDYMRMALYEPGLGYYSGGATKFGEAGDFVTAPELSPLFGACIAETAAAVLQALKGGDVLEFGAGTGVLAAQILAGLERLDGLPDHYYIVDLSAELKQRQLQTLQARVPHLADRVVWLNELPDHLHGFIVANEVLDAIPCSLIHTSDAGVSERGVSWQAGQLAWADRPAGIALQEAVDELGLPPGYTTEVSLEARGFTASLATVLEAGAALLIDYGFPAREYYHPERHMGTLIGHYRHHSIHDPFFLPGLTDLTCHVDFSAIFEAGSDTGLMLEGYVNQAQYLLDTGILAKLEGLGADNAKLYLPAVGAVQKLTSPAEMGELFKVMAFSKNLALPALLPGFRQADESYRL
ncbi:SAM-dependent methyltransferase, MidA family [Andreprevotia lacus DSM 23236]|jgi:SAM-dependent MidA family methyltransferase|uniref:SAM-dependent methyltransferase, MidA family n=1 Tax=Andreprevotia lacus DSM 23236 TaxID=1121001 RepID=A0A1W1X1E1_9NEIS|nr:SAM-dependent methyltransferase [Andreprevotia lacus]SMC17762.1 SAM-dependent methyltransferase, MidA family [Andreprevotia lacus DSM 23236]